MNVYVLLYSISALLGMVLMRLWDLCPALSVFRIVSCVLLSTTCAVPWQLGLPSSCFFLLCCVGVHVTRQRAGSELAVPKSNSFFFVSQVYFWQELPVEGKGQCWMPVGVVGPWLLWFRLGWARSALMESVHMEHSPYTYLPSLLFLNFLNSFLSLLDLFSKENKTCTPMQSVCHSAASELVSSFQVGLTKECEVLNFCENRRLGRERRQWGKDSYNLHFLHMPRSNSQLACQHTR